MFLTFGFVLRILINHAVCLAFTRLVARSYPILVYSVSWMVQEAPPPKSESLSVPTTKQKISYASFFSCAQHDGALSCARMKDHGKRCGWLVSLSRQDWARNVYRTLSTMQRADQDFKTCLMEYAENCLCTRHSEDRDTLQKAWLAELASAYKVYSALANVLPSYFRPHRCVKGSESAIASDCRETDCILHHYQYADPRTLFAVNVYYDAVGRERIQVHGPLSNMEWDPDFDITPAHRCRRMNDARGHAALQLFRPAPSTKISVLLDYLHRPALGDDLKEGHLYAYVHPSTPDYVKIGWTGSVHERMEQWSMCDHNLQLVGYTKERIPFARRTEQLIHKYLEQKGLRRHFMGCASNSSPNRRCGTKHIEWFEIPTNEAMLIVERWVCWISTAQAYDQAGRLSEDFIVVLAQTVPAEEDETTWRFENILSMAKTSSGESLWHRERTATLQEPIAHPKQITSADMQPDDTSIYDLDDDCSNDTEPFRPKVMRPTPRGPRKEVAPKAVQPGDGLAEAELVAQSSSLTLRPTHKIPGTAEAPLAFPEDDRPLSQSIPPAPQTPLRKSRPSILSSHNSPSTLGDSPASSSSSISTRSSSIFSVGSVSSAASSATDVSQPPTPTPTSSSGREPYRHKSKSGVRSAKKASLSSKTSQRCDDADADRPTSHTYPRSPLSSAAASST